MRINLKPYFLFKMRYSKIMGIEFAFSFPFIDLWITYMVVHRGKCFFFEAGRFKRKLHLFKSGI